MSFAAHNLSPVLSVIYLDRHSQVIVHKEGLRTLAGWPDTSSVRAWAEEKGAGFHLASKQEAKRLRLEIRHWQISRERAVEYDKITGANRQLFRLRAEEKKVAAELETFKEAAATDGAGGS